MGAFFTPLLLLPISEYLLLSPDMSFVEVAKMAFFLRLVSCGKGVSCRSGLSDRYKHQHHPFVCHILDYASTVWDPYIQRNIDKFNADQKKICSVHCQVANQYQKHPTCPNYKLTPLALSTARQECREAKHAPHDSQTPSSSRLLQASSIWSQTIFAFSIADHITSFPTNLGELCYWQFHGIFTLHRQKFCGKFVNFSFLRLPQTSFEPYTPPFLLEPPMDCPWLHHQAKWQL